MTLGAFPFDLQASPHAPHFCDPTCSFVTPQLRQLMALWIEKRQTGKALARSDFGLKELSFAVSNIAFLDVVEDAPGRRFCVRLMGSRLETYVGPMTGRFIDEVLPPAIAAKWTAIFSRSLDVQSPLRWVGRVEVDQKCYYVFEKFCAPLTDVASRRAGLLVSTYYHAMEGDGGIARGLCREIQGACANSTQPASRP